MKGFYRSMYKGEDGVEKVLASTQFEVTRVLDDEGQSLHSTHSLAHSRM